MELDSSSPFHHLLHTNYIPTSDEAAQIRELCANPLNELARLETEISRTQALLQDLQRSYRRVKTGVDAHLALLSPMRNLPPEVLQLIFAMTLPSDRNPVMHASEAPVLLGRVCSGWRRIALTTPILWAFIHVVTPPVDYSESANSPGTLRMRAMEEWLARSGVCPLSISIWVSREAWGSAAAAASSPFVEAILPLANRWKHVELRVPSDALDSFHYLQATDVPLLQTLSITNGGSLARDDWSGNLVFLQHASRLHTLSLAHDGNVDLPSFPWAQLTSLSLYPTQEFFGLDTEMTLKMLSQCLSLRTCTLHFPSFPFGGQASVPTRVFTLPHLSALTVRATNFQNNDTMLSNIFDGLVLPGLRVLEVEDRRGDLIIFPALFRLLSRSACHLQKLKLTDVSPTSPPDSGALLALQAMDSLIEFTVQDRVGDEGEGLLSESFIEAMADGLCPNLRVVKFTQCFHFSDQTLFKFLKARSRPLGHVVRLQSAEIAFGRDAEPEFELDAAIRGLVEDGMEANIRHENDDFWDVFRVSPWEGLYSGR
ncbi:hypothetical protein K438DRAFT_1830441 [Mycena galopus ATCC 62051]|nr:hypothetical protein K438DRAFT_1830441 [Mycena galopus ATCC 62051]